MSATSLSRSLTSVGISRLRAGQPSSSQSLQALANDPQTLQDCLSGYTAEAGCRATGRRAPKWLRHQDFCTERRSGAFASTAANTACSAC